MLDEHHKNLAGRVQSAVRKLGALLQTLFTKIWEEELEDNVRVSFIQDFFHLSM